MTAWQSGKVPSNGITVHYTRTGGTKPPLVLAHGFSDDGLCWTPLAETLASDYDVIMVDSRGHGQSEAPESGYGIEDQAADLAGVINALKLEQPIVLGHSMGAVATLALASFYPDLPQAVILEDPPSRWVPQGGVRLDQNWQTRARTQIIENQSKTREELIAQQRTATPQWAEAELGPWADAKHRLSLNVLNRIEAGSVHWPALVTRITCPVLLITADATRGALVTDDAAQQLSKLVPQVRVSNIPGAGHCIRRDQPAKYLAVVREFIAGLVPV
jgi:N-formylmaleamate deformylase